MKVHRGFDMPELAARESLVNSDRANIRGHKIARSSGPANSSAKPRPRPASRHSARLKIQKIVPP